PVLLSTIVPLALNPAKFIEALTWNRKVPFALTVPLTSMVATRTFTRALIVTPVLLSTIVPLAVNPARFIEAFTWKRNVPLLLLCPLSLSVAPWTSTRAFSDTPVLLSTMVPLPLKPAKLIEAFTWNRNVPFELTAPLMLMVATRTLTLAVTATPLLLSTIVP